jgi:hypothetical protein
LVRICGFHPQDPGSNPGVERLFVFFGVGDYNEDFPIIYPTRKQENDTLYTTVVLGM